MLGTVRLLLIRLAITMVEKEYNGMPAGAPPAGPAESAPVSPALAASRPAYMPSLRETLVVLGCVVAVDGFLYPVIGGTGYGLLVLVMGLALFLVTPARRAVALPLLVMTLALGIRNIWQTGLLPVVLPPICLMIGLSLQRRKVDHWLDGLVAGAISVPAGLGTLGRHADNLHHLLRRRAAPRRGGCLASCLPVAAAALVVLVFGGIFILANPVVELYWGELLDKLELEVIFRFFLRLLSPVRFAIWFFVAVAAAGLLRRWEPLRGLSFGEDQRVGGPSARADFTGKTSAAALTAACLLFIAYILVDANYLFVHAELPPDISYSDYARRGTFWLTAALLLSTLCVGLATAQSELASRFSRTVGRLSKLWVALDLVLAVCVLRRIHFYIDESGLTPLRIIGLFGTFTVAAGVYLMGIKVNRRKNLAWLLRGYVAVFLIGLTVYAVIPRDNICSWYNANRAQQGELRPLMLLFRAQTPVPALPEYLALLNHPDPVVANGISAYLARRYAALLREEKTQRGGAAEDWRQYQWARIRAQRALAAAAPRLRADRQALTELARACGGYNAPDGEISEAWRTNQTSDLEWLDD